MTAQSVGRMLTLFNTASPHPTFTIFGLTIQNHGSYLIVPSSTVVIDRCIINNNGNPQELYQNIIVKHRRFIKWVKSNNVTVKKYLEFKSRIKL